MTTWFTHLSTHLVWWNTLMDNYYLFIYSIFIHFSEKSENIGFFLQCSPRRINRTPTRRIACPCTRDTAPRRRHPCPWCRPDRAILTSSPAVARATRAARVTITVPGHLARRPRYRWLPTITTPIIRVTTTIRARITSPRRRWCSIHNSTARSIRIRFTCICTAIWATNRLL